MPNTIAQKVEISATELSAMSRGELFEWSRANGMDNRSAFPRFKKALQAIGIDYATAREPEPVTLLEKIAAAARADGYKSARAWSREGVQRIYLSAQRGAKLWIEIVEGDAFSATVGAFVETAQHRNWRKSQRNMLLADAKPVVAIAYEVAAQESASCR